MRSNKNFINFDYVVLIIVFFKLLKKLIGKQTIREKNKTKDTHTQYKLRNNRFLNQ